MHSTNSIQTWDAQANEEAMQDGHLVSWLGLIKTVEEENLADSNVLDFGCNRGGFLKVLYKHKPYKSALGVDVARNSVAAANAQKGNTPVDYKHNEVLTSYTNHFDLAFSHEVLYLLPDLDTHATQIQGLLKQGGVYYVAIGEHTENPLWEEWKETISKFSEILPKSYSLQQIAQAFERNGFSVSVQKMNCRGFFPYNTEQQRYWSSPMQLIEFLTEHMIVFRFVRR